MAAEKSSGKRPVGAAKSGKTPATPAKGEAGKSGKAAAAASAKSEAAKIEMPAPPSSSDEAPAPPPAEKEARAPLSTGGKVKGASGKAASVAPSERVTSASGKIKIKKKIGSEKTPAVAVRTDEAIPIICRECYEDFYFDPAREGETIICPVCEHKARRPSDDLLAQIAMYRGIERKNFTTNAVLFGVGLVSYTSWLFLTLDRAKAENNAIFWGPLAVSIICFFALLVLSTKYEKARWETYF